MIRDMTIISLHDIKLQERLLREINLTLDRTIEILLIIFACTKSHDYIYGKPFHLYNGRLLLKSIFTKSIVKSPPRIQRFLLHLQK